MENLDEQIIKNTELSPFEIDRIKSDFYYSENAVKKGRNVILIIFILSLVSCFIEMSAFNFKTGIVIVNSSILLFLLGTYLLTFYKPFWGILIALIFYALVAILTFIGNPAAMLFGIIIKGGIIIYIITILKDVKDYDFHKSEMEYYNLND